VGELINLNPQSGIPDDIARDTEVAAAIAAHNVADWAHIEYLWRVFLPRDRNGHYVGYITDTEVASLIANHTAAVDPHPIYLTQVEGDGRYRQTATALTDADVPAGIARDAEVVSAIANHVAAVDPHPIYLTQAEGDGRYLQPTRQAVFQLQLAGILSPGAIASQLLGNIPTAKVVSITGAITVGGKVVPPGGLMNGQYNYNFAVNISTGYIEIHIKSSDFPNAVLPVMILVQYLP